MIDKIVGHLKNYQNKRKNSIFYFSLKSGVFFFFDYHRDQMAARPISATGDRNSASLYSQSNDIPEIARFKVFIIILTN